LSDKGDKAGTDDCLTRHTEDPVSTRNVRGFSEIDVLMRIWGKDILLERDESSYILQVWISDFSVLLDEL